MKKYISIKPLELSIITSILLNDIKPILPTKKNFLSKLSDEEVMLIESATRKLLLRETIFQQIENASIFETVVPEISKCRTKGALSYSYLKLLYLFDRDLSTMSEMKRMIPLFKLFKKEKAEKIYELELWELHVYGKLVTKGVVIENFDPVKKAKELFASKVVKDPKERQKQIMEVFQNSVFESLPSDLRVERWISLLNSNGGEYVRDLAFPGKYKGGKIDSSLPLDQRIQQKLKGCLYSTRVSKLQHNLMRLLLEKGFKQVWITESLVLPQIEKWSNCDRSDSFEKEKKEILDDLLALKNYKMDNISSILVGLLLFPDNKKLNRKDELLRHHLSDEVTDLSYLHVENRDEVIGNSSFSLDSMNSSIKKLYCYEIGIQNIKKKNTENAVFWFSKAVKFHEFEKVEVPRELIKALVCLYMNMSDSLSSLSLLNSDLTCFSDLRVSLKESIKFGFQNKYNKACDDSVLDNPKIYKFKDKDTFTISQIKFKSGGVVYELYNSDLVIEMPVEEAVFSMESSVVSEGLSNEEREERTQPIAFELKGAALAGPSNRDVVIATSKAHEDFIDIPKKEKKKTRGTPYEHMVREVEERVVFSENEDTGDSSLDDNNVEDFLSKLRNINALDFRKLISKVPDFLGFESGGRHTMAVIETENGEKRVAMPNGHGDSVPIGTARSVVKDVFNL
jgi:hypothetical protein